jgi:hypothetical protein
MPKVKWGVTGSEVDEIEDDDYQAYDGPIPPAGVYRLRLEKAEYTKFKSDNKGIALRFVVDDPRRDKKQYNGCPVWENLVDVKEADFRIKQFLKAIGATGKDWDNTVIDASNNVTKVGRVALDGLHVRAMLKRGANQNNEPRAEVSRLLPPANADADTDNDGGNGDDEGEAPF